MVNKKQEKRGLGRGLSALMADINVASPDVEDQQKVMTAEHVIPIEKIEPNPDQPRRDFSPENLEELANSIRTKGVIQPLIVRTHPTNPDHYQIVAGERRWRASQIAKLHELPVIIREFDDTEVLEVAIIENIQRADLNPVEEAMGYRQLQDKFGHTQEQLATALGKSRSHIANLMRLLSLPDDVLKMLRDGSLTAGHARTLITSDRASALAHQIVKSGLSVREAEKLANSQKPGAFKTTPKKIKTKDADTVALEADLSATLKMPVQIDHRAGDESGKLILKYRDFEQLDEICRLLSGM